ncbi:MAG: tRNA threonylcarbamoyladenosine dehydratase [Christensenellales bacterium]
MKDWLIRSRALLGDDGIEKLTKARVALFGVGGVGSFAAEAICRSGVGTILLADMDNIEASNTNRQIHALAETVGQPKAETMKNRLLQINPAGNFTAWKVRFDETTAKGFHPADFDLVLDAMDTADAKVTLAVLCRRENVKLIASMGAANRLYGDFYVVDIYKTQNDPLARVMRRYYKQAGIEALDVVCAAKSPVRTGGEMLGSVCFATGAAGLCLAGSAVRYLLSKEGT